MSSKSKDSDGNKIYYLTVVFDKRYKLAKKYNYISNDLTIKKGDTVIVEAFGERKEAKVISAGFYTELDVPYPCHLTKHIISKADRNKSDDKQLYIVPTNNIAYDILEENEWIDVDEAERDINKMPKELQLFAEAWKDKTDFSIDMSKCGNSPLAYYIKSAEVTFKYKDKWYQFTPDNFGTSNEVFDRVCCGREMREALKRLGAEKVFQTSVLD